jgi:hypothetical protein
MMMVIIWLMMVHNNLVGGLNPSEKYELVSWDDDSQYVRENIKNVSSHQPLYPFLCFARFFGADEFPAPSLNSNLWRGAEHFCGAKWRKATD